MAQFLNPFNLAPKLPNYEPGFMSGILRNQERENYDNLLNQSMLLQQMGIQEQALGLSNKMKDVPLMDMERQDKMTTMDARRPFLGQLATGEAEDKLRGYDFNRQTHKDKVLATLSDYKTKIGDNKWKEETRSLEITADLVNRASQMGPQGLDYIKSEMDRLEKLGYKIPASVANPESWPMLQNAFKNTLPHIRALDLKDKEQIGKMSERAVIESGLYGRQREQLEAQERMNNARIAAENARRTKDDRVPRTSNEAIIKAMQIFQKRDATPEERAMAEDWVNWFRADATERHWKAALDRDTVLMQQKLTPAERQARQELLYQEAEVATEHRLKGLFGRGSPIPGGRGGREDSGAIRNAPGAKDPGKDRGRGGPSKPVEAMTPEEIRLEAARITERERGLK